MPPWAATDAFFETVRERGVAVRSRRLRPPDLDDPQRIRAGAGNYEAMCAECHAAPGLAPSDLPRTLHPPPPDLTHPGLEDPRRTFWIIAHGLRMTAMPAWGAVLDDEELWSLTAFVHRLPLIDRASYLALVEASAGHTHGGSVLRHGPAGGIDGVRGVPCEPH